MTRSLPDWRTSPNLWGLAASVLVVPRSDFERCSRTELNLSLSQSTVLASSRSSSLTQTQRRSDPRINSCDPTNDRKNFRGTLLCSITFSASDAVSKRLPPSFGMFPKLISSSCEIGFEMPFTKTFGPAIKYGLILATSRRVVPSPTPTENSCLEAGERLEIPTITTVTPAL